MMSGGGGGGGGGGRRIPGPPRNGRKDRDEDLLLFREMHKREKERIASLLQPVSEEFEPNGGNYPLYRMASAKKGSGYEFLAETDKNDYDWLKTPPATPLFPSLEMETINAPELAVQRELPIMQPPSRFYVSNSEASKAGNGRPKSPIPNPNLKPRARLRSVTPSNERPSISLAEAKNYKGAQNMNQKITTQLSSDLISRRSNMGNSTTPKAMNQKESNLNFLTSNLSKNVGTDSKSKPRSRGVSPLVRSTIPAQIPGFSDETPPNLRTDERSLSASRGRPSNPTVTNTRQKPESTVKPIRRQSCSPSVTRGRKVEANCKQEITSQGNQRGSIQTGNGTQVFGSRMVERVMNARKSGAEEREAKPKSRGGSINEGSGSGFGRMMSKSSLDVALKHMEITKRDHANFRHPAGNTLGKSSKPTTTTTTTSIS